MKPHKAMKKAADMILECKLWESKLKANNALDP